MANTPLPKPTAAEMDMLALIWRTGPGSARQIHQAAVADRPDITYATVLRVLQIMHSKGLLVRDEENRPHVYRAAHEQGSLQTNLLGDFIQKAFGGSGKALVMAALRGHVSDKERAEIEALLKDDQP
ncbi:MAG TPA: BlaI/MecI/CopY family transcriptional regulator [Burkholderiaceae bacterium]